ncbi:MAG: flagellar basal body-associated FliL family protein [Actinomycetes bacterium]
MAKKTDDEGTEAPEKKKKSNKLLLIIILVVVLAGAAYFFVLKPKDAAPAPGSAAAEQAAAAAAAALPDGPVIRLDPIFINLAGGHYLKLGMGLQTMGPQSKEEPTDGALALDAAIQIYSNQDMNTLTDQANRDTLKKQLVEMVTKGYHLKVSDVYITEFVMQ